MERDEGAAVWHFRCRRVCCCFHGLVLLFAGGPAFYISGNPFMVCPGFGDISFTAGAVVFCCAGRALLLYGGREAQSRRPGSIQEHEKLRAGGDPGIPAPTSHGPRWGPTGETRSGRGPALVLGHEKPELFFIKD